MNDELFSPKLLASALDVEGVLDVDAVYLVACSLAWNRSRNVHAGRELVRGLASRDPVLQELAEMALLERAADSLALVEGRLASGQLQPEQAASCLQKLFLAATSTSGSSNQRNMMTIRTRLPAASKIRPATTSFGMMNTKPCTIWVVMSVLNALRRGPTVPNPGLWSAGRQIFLMRCREQTGSRRAFRFQLKQQLTSVTQASKSR